MISSPFWVEGCVFVSTSLNYFLLLLASEARFLPRGLVFRLRLYLTHCGGVQFCSCVVFQQLVKPQSFHRESESSLGVALHPSRPAKRTESPKPSVNLTVASEHFSKISFYMSLILKGKGGVHPSVFLCLVNPCLSLRAGGEEIFRREDRFWMSPGPSEWGRDFLACFLGL